MLFQLSNESVGKITHCGVLEFTADEGLVYFPYWVYNIPSIILLSLFSLSPFLNNYIYL